LPRQRRIASHAATISGTLGTVAGDCFLDHSR
jgi:hypothetical protein